MIKLVLRWQGTEQPVEFAHLPVSIGRNPDQNLHIDDKMASRSHARIEAATEAVRLVDLDSRNGTFLNGLRVVTQVTLKPGDVIRIGDVEIVVMELPVQTLPKLVTPQAASPEPAAPVVVSAAALAFSPVPRPEEMLKPIPFPEAAPPSPPAVPFAPSPHTGRLDAPPAVAQAPAAPPAPAAPVVVPPSKLRLLLAEDIVRAAYLVLAIVILVGVAIVAREWIFGLFSADSETTRKRKSLGGTTDEIAEGQTEWKGPDLEREAEIRRKEKEKHAALVAEANAKAEEEERKQAALLADKQREEEERLARIDEERKKKEIEAAAAIEQERGKLVPFHSAVDDLVRKYKFAEAVALCQRALKEVTSESARNAVSQRLLDVEGLRGMFESMLERIKAGSVRLEIADTVTVALTSADNEKWSGSAAEGAAQMTQRWIDTKPQSVYMIFMSASPSPGELYCLALFCFEHGLVDEGETALVDCYKGDQERKQAIDALLARTRSVAIPEGGFVLFKGEWITPEERSYIERGYVRYEGKWMTEEEMMTARGFVQHEGRWISREEKDKIEKREAELAALKLKLQPKGLIDKPGADTEGLPWSKARLVKTANYRIKSNLNVDAMNDCAYTMEVLHLNFKKVLGLEQKKMAIFQVNVARTAAEYHKDLGGPQGALGHCSSEGEICAFYLPGEQGLNTTSVLMHEGTHQFVFRISPNAPIWMHEGMATYFECSKFDGRDLKIGLKNKLRLGTIQGSIQNGTYAPLSEFIAGKGGDPYSQGWALVYYLIHAHKGRYARCFDVYLRKVGSQMEPKHFMKAFGVKDLDAFEDDWKAFVLGLSTEDAEDQADTHK